MIKIVLLLYGCVESTIKILKLIVHILSVIVRLPKQKGHDDPVWQQSPTKKSNMTKRSTSTDDKRASVANSSEDQSESSKRNAGDGVLFW